MQTWWSPYRMASPQCLVGSRGILTTLSGLLRIIGSPRVEVAPYYAGKIGFVDGVPQVRASSNTAAVLSLPAQLSLFKNQHMHT